jgi:hypothetical protein
MTLEELSPGARFLAFCPTARSRSSRSSGTARTQSRSPQLEVLAAQLADLLPLSAGQQIGAPAAVRLGLAHLLPERLGADAEISGDVTPLDLESARGVG